MRTKLWVELNKDTIVSVEMNLSYIYEIKIWNWDKSKDYDNYDLKSWKWWHKNKFGFELKVESYDILNHNYSMR